MKKLILLSAIFVFVTCCHCQQFQPVTHCPSKEIYDMIIDKKGFVWIAHNLGVSRYDGISFTSFTNPAQNALSMTDLIEDNYGRIWCHNFNNQIFYIQNNQLHYFKDYDFTKEKLFPQMVLLHDELVVSSIKGLFICDTKTLKSKYIDAKLAKLTFGISEICLLGNSVLGFAHDKGWFTYSRQRGIRPVTLEKGSLNTKSNFLKLSLHALNDTAFAIDNSSAAIYGLVVNNGKVKQVFSRSITSHINTVTILKGQAWVNTTGSTFSLNGGDTIRNYNISKLMFDTQNNLWITTLSHGLLLSYKTEAWRSFNKLPLSATDYIKCIARMGQSFILCSEAGKVLSTNSPLTNHYLHKSSLLYKAGSPEKIQYAYDSLFFIESSKLMSIYNLKTGQVKVIDSISAKDLVVDGNTAYIATSFTLYIKDIRLWGLNSKTSRPEIKLGDSLIENELPTKRQATRKVGRTRAVMLDTVSEALFVSYNDGLHMLKKEQIKPVQYIGLPLYVSSMAKYQSKVYAATYNLGLFLIDSKGAKKIQDPGSSQSDAIFKIKCCNNHLWIFRSHDIQVLDAKTDKFINIAPLPVDASDVTDVEEDSSKIYLTTYYGLYSTPLNGTPELNKTNISLLYTLVNNTDTLFANNITLPSHQNNLLFSLALPIYNNADRVHFKYALLNGSDDTTWYYTQDAQRDIQFNALKPGNYSLTVTAVKDNEVVSKQPLIYNFIISQPWFNTWWFYTFVLLSVIAILLALQQYRLKQILKIERIRRKISSDLHDDIGSTLSSINVYSQLAKKEDDNKEYIETIQQNTVSIISNLDDLVWNINPKNDVLENMVARMRLFAEPLLSEKHIECSFTADIENPNAHITPNLRTNIYLLFKEIINNVVKHADCHKCGIQIIHKNKALILTVKDDGKGFNTAIINRHRNGLHNMQQRAKDIRASIVINSLPGHGTEITVSCRFK